MRYSTVGNRNSEVVDPGARLECHRRHDHSRASLGFCEYIPAMLQFVPAPGLNIIEGMIIAELP